MEEGKKKKQKYLFIIGIVFLIFLVIGASFAYFQIIANTDSVSTSLIGEGTKIGQPTMTTGVSELKLNITQEMMNNFNVGKSYYATEDGTALLSTRVKEGKGRYVLATMDATEGETLFDCTFAYDLSATVTKEITDGSDEHVKIVLSDSFGTTTTYTLKQLLNGITHTGEMLFVKYGKSKKIYIEAYVTNTSEYQDDLNENSFTINIEPSKKTVNFKCDISTNWLENSYGKPLASCMTKYASEIDGLWSSGLEGDGLRYVGTGPNMCSYDNGAYKTTTAEERTTCPTLYNYTRTTISSGATSNYTYETSCPSNTSTYNYECTGSSGTLLDGNVPDNFICFGTTSMDECKSNEEKYMYRIIGVFADEEGNQHLKLRKFKQLGKIVWNSNNEDKNWGESTLYTRLNGGYFLENTTYSYLQDEVWSDKIVEWKWTAVNTKTYDGSKGPKYLNTSANVYLHEMNRSTKTSEVGEWTYPTGKIGLIYASDYALSLGDEALALTGSVSNISAKLKTGWLHYTNDGNSSSNSDWTLARLGASGSGFRAWEVTSSGNVTDNAVTGSSSVTPVFYLTPETTISAGTGTYSEPYIIG